MPTPWRKVDEEITDEGHMVLLERGGQFIIRMDHYTLMTSEYSVSEVELGRRPAGEVAGRPAPRVLVAGLGLGFTLRAALDQLPADARVVVAELNEVVAMWCRGPLAGLTDGAVDDPRVDLRIADVARVIADAAAGEPFDAIVLDLYQGTHDANSDPDHPHYGRRALETTRRALAPDGVLAVWTESWDPGFEQRLERTAFAWERVQAGPRGSHIVYLARRTAAPDPPRRRERGRRRR